MLLCYLVFCMIKRPGFDNRQDLLSFDGNFLSFSLAQGPPRDLQIIAYKYDSAHAHNRLA